MWEADVVVKGGNEVRRRGKLVSKFDTGSRFDGVGDRRSWRRSCFTTGGRGGRDIECTACWTSASSGADMRASRLTPSTWNGSSIREKEEDDEGGEEGTHQVSLLFQFSIPRSGGRLSGRLSASFSIPSSSSTSSFSSSSSFTLQLLWLLRLSQS